MTYSRIPLIATLALLAACSKDSTSPTDIDNGDISGAVSFTYTGGGGGSYSATGALASSATKAAARTTTWATGWKVNSDISTTAAANIARTGGLADLAGIIINRQTTGAATINTTCSPTTTTSCAAVFLVVGNSASGSWTFLCTLESGTINITSISTTSVTGTFSGTGSCLSWGSPLTTSAFTVTNGSFNVPLLANIPGNI